MAELLTHSRMVSAKTCLKKHYYRYELGLQKDRPSQPLRMGSAVHKGLETGKLPPKPDCPDWAEDHEWDIEWVKVYELLKGYWHYWHDDRVTYIKREMKFELPINNPETGHPTPSFKKAGIIDAIGEMDGTLYLVEHKTTSDTLDEDSDYWKRLRLDQQISHYMIAARELGYPVASVFYDVIKKPTIRPRQIPEEDELGKIVLDACGDRVFKKNGDPRATGDKAKGYVLQSRVETAEEYGARLSADIDERPEFYFARQEIPRLESDLDEFRSELWEQQKLLSLCRLKGYWYRNTAACTSPYRCEYFDICRFGGEGVPEGYILGDKHPELREEE